MVLAERADEVADLDDLLRVEADRGLVEDDDGRIADEGLGDADALPVALREVADEAVLDVVDLRNLADLFEVTLAVEPARLDVVDEVQVFLHRHVDVERRLLGEEADELLRLVRVFEDVDAADLGLAGRGGEVAGEDVHRGGFPRAVGAEESDDLALADREGDIVDGEFGAVVFHEVVDFDHGSVFDPPICRSADCGLRGQTAYIMGPFKRVKNIITQIYK